MAERSGLTERADVNTVVLELAQRPIAAWIFLAFFVGFGGMVLASLFPVLACPGISAFIGTFVLMFAAMLYAPKLVVAISPGEVRVDGWIGRLPTPSGAELPLLGTTVEWTEGAKINDVQVYVLRITNGETTVVIPSLRCKASELRELRERLEGMQLLGQAVLGEGLQEVPDDLERIRETTEPLVERE